MTQNLVLSRGKFYFAPFLAGTQNPDGERYIGNTPSGSITVDQSMLDHFSSDSGVKEKDASIPIEINRGISLSTDNIDGDNLAIVFLGTKSTLTTTLTTVTDEAIAAVTPGLYYQLGASATNPSGARGLTDVSSGVHVVVTNDAATPVEYDVDADYTIDMTLGRLYIVPGGAIADGTNLEVDYKVAAGSREQVISGNDAVEGQLRFIADNPTGDNRDVFLPWVRLTPNGEIDFKAEGWQAVGFKGEILKKVGYEAIYVDGRAVAA